MIKEFFRNLFVSRKHKIHLMDIQNKPYNFSMIRETCKYSYINKFFIYDIPVVLLMSKNNYTSELLRNSLFRKLYMHRFKQLYSCTLNVKFLLALEYNKTVINTECSLMMDQMYISLSSILGNIQGDVLVDITSNHKSIYHRNSFDDTKKEGFFDLFLNSKELYSKDSSSIVLHFTKQSDAALFRLQNDFTFKYSTNQNDIFKRETKRV